MRVLFVMLAAFALAMGCQAKPAARAGAPTLIAALTDETLVWTCPQCGMDYTGPGTCSMCEVDLVKTRVAYICPADDQPVARSGKCPRCDASAKVVKTAVADGAPGKAPGTSTPDAGAASGSASGS